MRDLGKSLISWALRKAAPDRKRILAGAQMNGAKHRPSRYPKEMTSRFSDKASSTQGLKGGNRA